MFVDGWGNPYLFQRRWATGDTPVLDSLTPVGGTSKLRDPTDSMGLLLNSTWYGTANRTAFETAGHSVTKNNAAYAYYLIPVIMSCGPDGKPGITPANFATMTVSTPADAKDNIYSYLVDRE